MTGQADIVSQTVRRFWSLIYGRQERGVPDVVLHDPAARRAHDLDDPYFDGQVQARIGDVIAGTAQKK